MRKSIVMGFAVLLLGSSGWLFALNRQDELPQGRLQLGERQCSRVLYFGNRGIAGQFFMSYSSVGWKDAYAEAAESVAAGERVRLGKDFWANLDTNIPLEIGGVAVAPGGYYIAAMKGEDDAWSLVLLDSAKIREQKMDAFQSGQTTGGIVIPLEHSMAEDNADELSMTFSVNNQTRAVAFDLEFGPHRASASVVPKL